MWYSRLMRGRRPILRDCAPSHIYCYSDARSAQVVDDVIRPALESGKHIKKNKPYLIVIDEIDGATGGSDTVSGPQIPESHV